MGWGFSKKPWLALEYEREGKEMKRRKKSTATELARKKRKNIAGGDTGPSTQTCSDEVSKISNLLIKVKLIKKFYTSSFLVFLCSCSSFLPSLCC